MIRRSAEYRVQNGECKMKQDFALCTHYSPFIMVDLHTHSLLSDGALLPEELVRPRTRPLRIRFKNIGWAMITPIHIVYDRIPMRLFRG